MKIETLKDSFKKVFGEEKEMRVFFSPGRVNLIGEHIDYNGGCVFPSLKDGRGARQLSTKP